MPRKERSLPGLEVLKLMAEVLPTKRLPNTSTSKRVPSRPHIIQIFKKLGVKGRPSAIAEAVKGESFGCNCLGSTTNTLRRVDLRIQLPP